MRWADTGCRWWRPLHAVLALFAGEPLTVVLDLHGATLHFGVTTRGHRFLSPAKIEVRSFADYRKGLEKAYVILDAAARRASIERQLDEIVAAEDLRSAEHTSEIQSLMRISYAVLCLQKKKHKQTAQQQ